LIFQGDYWSRIMVAFISQAFIIILFFFLVFKILKRNRKRSSITLAAFYFLLSVGLFMNIIFILLISSDNNIVISLSYNLASYFIIFPFIFILIFINVILKMEENFTLKKIMIIIVIYGVLCSTLYIIPGGITFTSNWIPIYSIHLFVYVNIIFTGYITIPILFYSIRLYSLFKARNLKEKLRIFLIGIYLMLGTVYGAIYFNTTSDPIFRTVWGICAVIMEITAGLLVYYGIGKDL